MLTKWDKGHISIKLFYTNCQTLIYNIYWKCTEVIYDLYVVLQLLYLWHKTPSPLFLPYTSHEKSNLRAMQFIIIQVSNIRFRRLLTADEASGRIAYYFLAWFPREFYRAEKTHAYMLNCSIISRGNSRIFAPLHAQASFKKGEKAVTKDLNTYSSP